MAITTAEPRRTNVPSPVADMLSPPTSPVDDDEGIDLGGNGGVATGEAPADEDISDVENSISSADPPSSPPTSVETPPKKQNGSLRTAGDAGVDDYGDDDDDDAIAMNNGRPVEASDADKSEYGDDQRNEGSVRRSGLGVDGVEHGVPANLNDIFQPRQSQGSKNWETSSQWEDEEAENIPIPASSPPRGRNSLHSHKSVPLSSPFYPRPRPSGGAASSKSHLNARATSRASSGSLEPRDERKAPLVLLHVTLLLLPGAEEEVLGVLTPTMLERGLLIEHPRGDYHLLEELILDALGLDDDYFLQQSEEEDDDAKTDVNGIEDWERSLGVRRVEGRRTWDMRVYASNGLMTAGAWRRVWGEMERIDVELWPKGFDRKKSRVGVSPSVAPGGGRWSGNMRNSMLTVGSESPFSGGPRSFKGTPSSPLAGYGGLGSPTGIPLPSSPPSSNLNHSHHHPSPLSSHPPPTPRSPLSSSFSPSRHHAYPSQKPLPPNPRPTSASSSDSYSYPYSSSSPSPMPLYTKILISFNVLLFLYIGVFQSRIENPFRPAHATSGPFPSLRLAFASGPSASSREHGLDEKGIGSRAGGGHCGDGVGAGEEVTGAGGLFEACPETGTGDGAGTCG